MPWGSMSSDCAELAIAATSMAGVTLMVFWSNAAAQALLVTVKRLPLAMAVAFSVARTVNVICSLWPGARARLPSVRLSATSVGRVNASALLRAVRLQRAWPVKLVAGFSKPLVALGALVSAHEAIEPFGLSISNVQLRLSITRTLGAGAGPVLVTFSV